MPVVAKKIACLLICFACLSLLQSCQQTVTSKCLSRNPVKKDYPKLQEYNLQLELLNPRRRFYTGEEIVLNFRLKNKSAKTLKIEEWYMNEPDNIRLYYRPYSSDLNLNDFKKADWSCLEPEYAKNRNHFPLIISPANSVLIDKVLPIAKEAENPQSNIKSGKYYVLAELTLSSVDLRSDPILIEIR